MRDIQILQRQLKPAYNSCPVLYNWFLLSIPSIAFFGCQIAWSLQNGFTTPQLQILGLPAEYINYVWLAGPISGIIIQPLIGVWSDSIKNKNNRRRPFILFGTLSLIISLLLFSNSSRLFSNYGLLIGIIAFCFQDISVNMVQAPLRALISDIIPTQFHSTSNSLFGLFNGIGCSIGYGLGAVLSYNDSLGGGISILYGVASLIILIASFITLYWSKNERILQIDANHNDELTPLIATSSINNAQLDEDETNGSKFRIVIDAIYCMPTPIFRSFIVQFLVHYAHCCIAMYLTDWFGKNIMDGEPISNDTQSVKLYQKGVRYATFALFLMSLLSIPISLLLPKLCQKFGSKLVWFTSCLVYCSVMATLSLLCVMDNININIKAQIAIILISCCSFPLSTSKVIGWTIVTKTLCCDSKTNTNKRALYTTIFNLANASPGIFVSIISGSILMTFNHNVSAILIMASIASFVAAISCCFIIDI